MIGQFGNQSRHSTSADFSGDRIHIDAASVADAVARRQADRAAIVHEAGGFEAARVVDDAALQTVGRLRRQDDQPTGRVHGIAVFNQRGNRGRFDANVGQSGAVKLQLISFASRQCHRTALGDNDTVVAHFGGQQGDESAKCCGQLAFVLDFPGGAVAGEIQLAGHEVGIADAVRGGRERTHVHAGTAPEVDAAWVGEEDLAVGVDAAEDLARVGGDYAVECRRAAGRLVEVHRRRSANIEGAPVDHALMARLVDVHRGAGLGDVRGTGNNITPGRERVGRRGGLRNRRRWQDGDGCREQQGFGGALAPALGDLRYGHPGVDEFVPDEAKGLVHVGAPECLKGQAGGQPETVLVETAVLIAARGRGVRVVADAVGPGGLEVHPHRRQPAKREAVAFEAVAHGGIVVAHVAIVMKTGDDETLGQSPAQLEVAHHAAVAAAFVAGVGAHATGTAKIELLRAIEIVV